MPKQNIQTTKRDINTQVKKDDKKSKSKSSQESEEESSIDYNNIHDTTRNIIRLLAIADNNSIGKPNEDSFLKYLKTVNIRLITYDKENIKFIDYTQKKDFPKKKKNNNKKKSDEDNEEGGKKNKSKKDSKKNKEIRKK